MYNVAWFTLQDRAAAEEVTQDVFVRLFQSLARFRHESTLATWLHRVAINRCHDVLRSRSRERRTLPLELVSETRLAASPRHSPDATIMQDATDDEVRRAIARLPEEMRTAISLRYAAEMSYADIARVLELPLGSVCSRLHRALKLLATELGAPPREEPS